MSEQAKPPPKVEDNFDKELENGPVAKRSCTDIICWIIWVSSLSFWGFSIFYGLSKGDPTQVFAPWDEAGNQCGYTTAVKDYKYAYFYVTLDPSMVSQLKSKIVCVSKCPSYSSNPAVTALSTLAALSITCVDTVKSAAETSTSILASGTSGCTNFYGYKAYSFLGLYCVPNTSWINSTAQTLSAVSTQFNAIFDQLGYMRKWVDDLKECWYIILAGFAIAVFISILYCYFLRCCAGVVTWIILLTLMFGMYLGGWLSYDTARKYQDDADAATTAATASGGTADVSDYEWNRNWFYVGAGISWFCALIFTCVVCCNYHKIALIIAIIKASGRFVNDNLLILLVPVINTIIALSLLILWFVGVIYLYSVGTVTQNTTYPWSNVAWESFTEGAFYFNLFFGLWVLAFMVSFNVFVIASATVIWFFDQGKGQEAGSKSKKNPCCTGYCWAIGWHMGSIAFGSFILAVIWAIQIIMAYIDRKMKNAQAANKCIACMFKCVHCCLACFERFIQFLNKQAYIQVALTNSSFCSSAWKAFVIILSHMIDFTMLS